MAASLRLADAHDVGAREGVFGEEAETLCVAEPPVGV